MSYLLNPYGRMVAVDDPNQYIELQNKGFRKPTIQQENEFIQARYELFERQKGGPAEDKSIYFATVSQGGKDGYSIASGALMRELKKLNVETTVSYKPTQKIAVLFHAPYSILRIEAPYRIIYTMFESTKIPDDWKDYLDAADKIIVPSKWCQEVFKKSGVKTEVVPLGYDQTVYKYISRENKAKKHKPFVFLHYNAFNLRKGFPEVLKAFIAEFKPVEPVRLLLKTTLDYMPIPITPSQYPNIDVILGKVSDKEMIGIMERGDCFVFPSRGEGFAMTPLEAMATGMPAIVPNAHGISEYFDSDYMYEVNVEGETPAVYARYKNQDVGKMFLSDVNDLRRKMRWVYEHQDEAMAKGEAASEYVKNWSIQKTAAKLKQVFIDIESRPIDKKPVKNILPLVKIQ